MAPCFLVGVSDLGPPEGATACDPTCVDGVGRNDAFATGADRDPGTAGEGEEGRPAAPGDDAVDQPEMDVMRRGPLVEEVRLALPPPDAVAAAAARWPLGTAHLKQSLRVP